MECRIIDCGVAVHFCCKDQQILMLTAKDPNTALVHYSDQLPLVSFFYPHVVFTSIAMLKSLATSTEVFKFSGVLRRCHCQNNSTAQGSQLLLWQERSQEHGAWRVHSILSVSEAACASARVTSLKSDLSYIQFNSISYNLKQQALLHPQKQGHSLEWCWLKTVHNCK